MSIQSGEIVIDCQKLLMLQTMLHVLEYHDCIISIQQENSVDTPRQLAVDQIVG